MADQTLLELEVRLLILKHGYNRVIQALAHVRKDNPENVERLISEAEQQKARKVRSNKVTVLEIASIIASEHPQIASHIQQLGMKFENRFFLPQMKDVRRFLEKNGVESRAIKSRQDATRKVFDALSRMSPDELSELVESSTHEQSDLSIIADQIIGKKST